MTDDPFPSERTDFDCMQIEELFDRIFCSEQTEMPD